MSPVAKKPGSTRAELIASARAAAARALGATIAFATRATTEPIASWLLLLPALVAIAYTWSLVGIRLWYEAHTVYNVDTPLYWTIGHGILKGLVPYRDLYETKPPGIFLVSALSYLVTGGGALTHGTQVLSLAFVALAPLVFARRLLAGGRQALPAMVVFAALWAIVLLLVAYVEDRGIDVQVEPHAVAGMVLYLLFIGGRGRRAFWARTLGIGLAIGMKEPFVLMVPAVYLVYEPSARRPLHDFWGPLATACLLGATILLLLGWLPAYVGIYLKSMTGAHVQIMGSPWDRLLVALSLIWDDLRTYSHFLPAALFFCGGVYLLSPERPAADAPEHFGNPPPPRDVPMRRFQGVLLGVMLAALAVGMGGQFYAHHHLAAVPLYLALIFSLMSRLGEGTDVRGWVRPALIAVTLMAVLINPMPLAEFRDRVSTMRIRDSAAHESAEVIDAVVDRVGAKRYLWIGPGGFVPFAFTRHLPLGPLFFQQIAFFEGRYPWFVNQFRKRLAEAKVVVVAEYMMGPLSDEFRAQVARDFVAAPARFIPPGKHCQYPILVRRGLELH